MRLFRNFLLVSLGLLLCFTLLVALVIIEVNYPIFHCLLYQRVHVSVAEKEVMLGEGTAVTVVVRAGRKNLMRMREDVSDSFRLIGYLGEAPENCGPVVWKTFPAEFTFSCVAEEIDELRVRLRFPELNQEIVSYRNSAEDPAEFCVGFHVRVESLIGRFVWTSIMNPCITVRSY